MKSLTDLTHPRGGGPLVNIDQRIQGGQWGAAPNPPETVWEELKGLSSEQLEECTKFLDTEGYQSEPGGLKALMDKLHEENRLRDEHRANGARVRVVEMTDEEFEAFKNRPRGVTVLDVRPDTARAQETIPAP